MKEKSIQLIECPRDAMQGWKSFIPTANKIEYINSLLRVGFHTLDMGSFVSPKAIPQMADTKEVLKAIDRTNSNTSLLTIVANERGAEEAVVFDSIQYLGFPFSVSETFQIRNTNSTPVQSLERVARIQELCVRNQKTLVVYLSMAFGNPYGDQWSEEIVMEWAGKLLALDVQILSLADTVGVASPEQVYSVTHSLIQNVKQAEVGVHLHSSQLNWEAKLDAAWRAGCHRFDGALKGIGGCPMANDELVGNMNTENMVSFFEQKNVELNLNKDALFKSLELANDLFI